VSTAAAPRILVVDDHPVFRVGMAALLSKLPGAPRVSEASSLDGAWRAIEHEAPDCVTLDLQLPDGNGFTLLSKARRQGVSSRFVLVTTFDDPSLKRRAHALGVDGFATKEADPDDIAQLVLRVLAAPPRSAPCTHEKPPFELDAPPSLLGALSRLTWSERRVLRLLSKNRTSAEIAAALGVSPRTVQNHRAHICQKLGLRGPHRLLEVALELKDVLGES